jgi:glycosyltransferase involved in cell wall biosynthesis
MHHHKKLIYQCYPNLPEHDDGGMATYVHSILNYRSPNISQQVLSSLKHLNQSQFYLLHIHGTPLLQELQGTCPIVYTLHNHSSYCPSGTKYLAKHKKICERNMTFFGCTYGHLIDKCGSRRPKTILNNLQSSFNEFEILSSLKILVLTASNYVRTQLISNGFHPERIIALNLGVQLSAEPRKPLTSEVHERQKILFVGRITPEKGLDWLLSALQFTAKGIHLDIAGEGWARPQLEKLAKYLGLENRITWHGWCSREKLDILYQQCFAVTFTSVWPEPSGLVTLESYAHKRAIIASSAGGISEYVNHGETGLLVKPNDTQALAKGIADLASNFDKCRTFGEKGYMRLIKDFSMDKHIEQLQEVYNQAIKIFQEK